MKVKINFSYIDTLVFRKTNPIPYGFESWTVKKAEP